jgi:hypothetical protein
MPGLALLGLARVVSGYPSKPKPKLTHSYQLNQNRASSTNRTTLCTNDKERGVCSHLRQMIMSQGHKRRWRRTLYRIVLRMQENLIAGAIRPDRAL